MIIYQDDRSGGYVCLLPLKIPQEYFALCLRQILSIRVELVNGM